MYSYTYRGAFNAVPLYFYIALRQYSHQVPSNPGLLTGPADTAYLFQPYNSEVIITYPINTGSHLPRLSEIDFLIALSSS
jgi:hypothetical protein